MINRRRRAGAGRGGRRSKALKPNPRNPRTNFTDAELNELTESIKERGIIQPIVVRAADDG